jgi:hypothetical protein
MLGVLDWTSSHRPRQRPPTARRPYVLKNALLPVVTVIALTSASCSAAP